MIGFDGTRSSGEMGQRSTGQYELKAVDAEMQSRQNVCEQILEEVGFIKGELLRISEPHRGRSTRYTPANATDL